MSTATDVNAAIATFQAVFKDLEAARILIQNQHFYFWQAVEAASSQEERLVLIGAYLATRNLMQGSGQQFTVKYLEAPICAEIVQQANLQLHFGNA